MQFPNQNTWTGSRKSEDTDRHFLYYLTFCVDSPTLVFGCFRFSEPTEHLSWVCNSVETLPKVFNNANWPSRSSNLTALWFSNTVFSLAFVQLFCHAQTLSDRSVRVQWVVSVPVRGTCFTSRTLPLPSWNLGLSCEYKNKSFLSLWIHTKCQIMSICILTFARPGPYTAPNPGVSGPVGVGNTSPCQYSPKYWRFQGAP